MKNKKSVRLPNHIKPTKYNLTLKPDLEAFVFSGQEIIEITILKEIKKITLHSKNIDIETVKIISQKKNLEEFAHKIIYNTKAETVTFYFKKEISKGNYKLSIIFTGLISKSLRGFYRSKYIIDGETKHIATTQFEATDARRAFPCFDEPSQKAIFNVSLIIPTTETAISNTLPIEIKEHEAGCKIVSFEPTPHMSTYLLAFIIGDFESIEKKVNLSGRDVLVRVFTTKGKKHQAEFALDVAIKSIKFYNEYFDIPYPLPTLDLVAIPDFESGAMENWGAITFRESALLVDEEHTSLSNKQWVAVVIAHELAHQWFGNLVTMHWWTDLWLNEGFASYMENLCIDNIFPDWHIWDLYLGNRYNLALKLDSLSNSHPVEIKVNHPEEISEIFDMISYAKGSAIIRMLAEYLEKDKFRNGLRYYLKKYSYKNTKTINLWESFEKISGKPIKKMMNSWTKQTGYPLLSISSPESGSREIKQERFFSSRISKENNKTKYLWNIPLSYKNKTLLLTKKNNKLKGEIGQKINKGENSFIRVKYDEETLALLKEEIKNNRLNTRDRLGVIRDLFSLAEGGYIKTVTVLDFSLVYKNETEYIVWAEIASGLNRIRNIISDQSFIDKYEKYVLEIFKPIIKKMGWNKKDKDLHSDTFLRSLVLSQGGFYGDKNIIKTAQKLWRNKEKISVNTDIRSTVYGIVAKHGTKSDWNKFKKLYQNEILNEEKERYGYALTLFSDKNLLQETLKFIFSSDVKDQDTPSLITYIWQNEKGRDLTWKSIQKNWPLILKRYGEGGHFLSRLVSPLGNHTKIKDLNDAKKFFAKNLAPGAERALEQAYERIESNIAWIKDDKKDIKKWLEKI